MNTNITRDFLTWLDNINLKELLKSMPEATVKGHGYKRKLMYDYNIYNNDRKTYNAYTDSIMQMFYYELPERHSYMNNEGMFVTPEAALIYDMMISTNFDIEFDYSSLIEFVAL